MILHLASKCAILATALLPSSICYRLHKTFLWKGTKTMVNLKNISKFNQSILVIDANHCFIRILMTTYIPTSTAIIDYNGAFDIVISV